jgi:DNA repair photolyase
VSRARGQITANSNKAERLKTELERSLTNGKPKEAFVLTLFRPLSADTKEMSGAREVCDKLDYPVFIVTKSDLVLREKVTLVK